MPCSTQPSTATSGDEAFERETFPNAIAGKPITLADDRSSEPHTDSSHATLGSAASCAPPTCSTLAFLAAISTVRTDFRSANLLDGDKPLRYSGGKWVHPGPDGHTACGVSSVASAA